MSLELAYAKNTVVHMLSGKAISRAIRGHFLVDSALNCLLMRDLFNIPLVDDCAVHEDDADSDVYEETQREETLPTDNSEVRDDLEQVKVLYENLLADEVSLEEVCSSDLLKKLSEELQKKKVNSMKGKRTGRTLDAVHEDDRPS